MTVTTDDFLAHFGVKGMKWGVTHQIGPTGRVTGVREPKPEPVLVLTKKFSTGDSVSIYQDPPSGFVQLLSRHFKSYKEEQEKLKSFTFKDKDGTKVGDASFVRSSPDSLYLEWLGIKKDHRGKGYATAAMEGVKEYARHENIKKLTLEVPGNAPDARHIYEKMGFEFDGAADYKNDKRDAIWGGLYNMTLHVDSVKHANDDMDIWAKTFATEFAAFLIDNFSDLKVAEFEHSGLDSKEGEMVDTTDDFLAHFGVKGMKWGVRHDPNRAANRQTARIAKASDRAAKVRQKEAARQAQAKAEVQRAKNHDATVLKARKNLPKSARDLRIAKADYRVNKQTMGRAAAKEILNKHKQTYRVNKRNASLLTGKEQVAAQAEHLKQLQYREMMRQELDRQRQREATTKLLQDLLNPPRVTQPRYDHGPYGPPKPAAPRDGGHYTATPHRG